MPDRKGSRRRHHPMRSDDDSALLDPTPWTPSQVLLFATIPGLALALGGVHAETRVVAVGLLASAWIWRIHRLARDGLRPTLGWWGAAFALALVWVVLQFLPWPRGLLEILAPARVALADALASAAGHGAPGFITPSLDASLTAIGFVGLTLHMLAFMLGRHLRTALPARERLVIVIELAAAAVVIVGCVHQIMGFDRILGFYTASTPNAGGPFPTTFVNPNHFAALCMFAAVLALGGAIAVKRHLAWHATAGAIAAVGVAASLSRANALLMVLGWFVVALPSAFARASVHAERRVRARRVLVGMLALVFIGFVLLGPERWAAEFEALFGPDGRLIAVAGLGERIWGVAWEAAQVQPLMGLGSGALALATPGVVGVPYVGIVTHAHLAPIEVVAELGVVVGGAVLVLGVAGLVATWRHAVVQPLAWAMWVALLMLLLQNMVDFSWWMAGVGVGASAVAGSLSSFERGPPAVTSSSLRMTWLTTALVLVVTAFAAWFGLANHFKTNDIDASRWQALVAAHGADPIALEVAGHRAELEGDGAAARRLATLGLQRAPNLPSTIGRAFKFAVLDGQTELAAELVERLHAQGPSAQELAWTLVLGARKDEALLRAFFAHQSIRVIDGALRLERSGEGAAALELLRWGLTAFPDEPLIAETLGLRLGLDAAQRRERDRLATLCLVKAGEAPDEPSRARWERVAFLFEAEARYEQGRYLDAYRLFVGVGALDEAPGTDPLRARIEHDRRPRALFRAGDAALATGDAERVGSVVALLDAMPLEVGWHLAKRHVLRSRWFEMKSDWRPAIRELQAAIHLQPQVAEHHLRLAELFDRAGDPEAAARSRVRANDLKKSSSQ